MLILWPSHASDGGRYWEFVANSFLLSPISTYLIYEHDIIALGYSYLGGVR